MKLFAEGVDGGPIINKFKLATEEVAKIFKEEGLEITPYSDPNLPDFQGLSFEKQEHACKMISFYLQTLQMTKDQGKSIRDDKVGLWNALKLCELIPSSDIFGLIEKDDVIELFDGGHIQIWRSFRFMELNSYSIAQLFIYPSYERYERNERASKNLVEIANKLIGEDRPRTYKFIIQNILVETFGKRRLVLNYSHNYFSSLTNKSGGYQGALCLSKASLIDENGQISFEERSPKPVFNLKARRFEISSAKKDSFN